MNTEETKREKIDRGEIVATHTGNIAWVWIFPILAAMVAGWLFWKQSESLGPKIEITFEDAPGIQAGKTQLLYRGVKSGVVEAVELDKDLNHVVVKVQLEGFAAELASKNTDFWIERPVISITELNGLESIIQGNSIQARTQGGPPQSQFTGLAKPPLLPLEKGAFTIRLQSQTIPLINRGAPVYNRGIKVGVVREKVLDEKGRPTLDLYIEKEFRSAVRTNSRFWPIEATALQFGQQGLKLDIAGIDALIQGGISFDHYGEPGAEAASNSVFEFSANEFDARTCGKSFTVMFQEGRGLIAGVTKVCYLGQPVGLIDTVEAVPASHSVKTTMRLYPEYDALVDSATRLSLVCPRISLDGVTGLDTLITGVYIDMQPGVGGQPATELLGRTVSDREWQTIQDERNGMLLTLYAEKLPTIDKGAPVLHRGLTVGAVLKKSLDDKGRPILHVVIKPEFRNVISANTRFWRIPATSIKVGPGVLQVELESVEALVQGGVEFDSFGATIKSEVPVSEFQLFDDKKTAQAESTPIRIRFDNGRGLVAGRSELRYLGVPVGIVEEVETKDQHIWVVARLNSGYEFLRTQDAIYSVVRPNISLQGITGLETLVSGVYIECTPGSSKKMATSFVGKTTFDSEEITPTGLSVKLKAEGSPINPGAAIYYRGISVGRITEKSLSQDGRDVVLTAVINRKYSHLIHENTKFWDASGLKATLGFLKFRIQTGSVIVPDGQICFATPDNAAMGPAARDGDTFPLYPEPQADWAKWNPSIPTNE